ncbi:MAG: CRISPR-associated endonuclease Cas2 [Chromatiales bacterium]|nr:CRISPR-associated endonuclease Cas2 [Chromatiales bacterium]
MIVFGGLRTVWVLVMFDLPTDNAEARRHYTKFRQALLEDGFLMMQYSVYARHCASDENADVHVKRVKQALPPDGEIRVARITDKQFARMELFYGKCRRPMDAPPDQLILL